MTNIQQPHRSHSMGELEKAPVVTAKILDIPKYAFVGRLGGNQEFTLRRDAANAHLLAKEPDAAPGMTLKEQFDLRPFTTLGIWKAALMEGAGSFSLVFLTVYANISPSGIPVQPDAQLGYFDNAAYLGPLTGGLSNFLILSLFTFAFATVSGAHLNPTITFATFTVRLCTLPRAVLYIVFQTGGAALGGLLVRAGYGTRDFKTGGCWLYDDVVPVSNAFAVEFGATLALLFCAFGVGLDPRQRKVIPASLAPFLVGLTLGTISWIMGYSRFGFGGASMNPARCFGAFVGSSFPHWAWYNW